MINLMIKPLNQISGYDTRWGWDKKEREQMEESRFARRLRRRASDQQDNVNETGRALSFDNPAFNILTGDTSLTVTEIASDLKN